MADSPLLVKSKAFALDINCCAFRSPFPFSPQIVYFSVDCLGKIRQNIQDFACKKVLSWNKKRNNKKFGEWFDWYEDITKRLIDKYGEDVDSTWTAIALDRAFHGKIKEGDLFWLDGEKPIPELEEQYGIGSTANAVVKSVAYVNLSIAITLTRNKDQVKQ